jgi:uncharacterized protein YukJ
MPIVNYGVLIGRPVRRALDHDWHAPHYHLLVDANGISFHVAINIRSAIDCAELLYLIDDELQHPLTDRWAGLPLGFTRLPHSPTSGAIDFIRGQIVDRRRFRVAPRAGETRRGLPDLLDLYVDQAIEEPGATVYAFGFRWGPKRHEIDRTFGDHPITPSDGVHNIHMNQGNADLPERPGDRHFAENGPWRDGALVIHFAERDEWIGIFLAFQSQQWHSDDETGRPALHPHRTGTWQRPAGDEPDYRVRMIAAMINPSGPVPRRESVTLLNPLAETVDLDGWTIVNTERQATRLTGEIAGHETRVIDISPDAPLGKHGGTIALLDSRGFKVDGVAYTARQAAHEGRMITFGRDYDTGP